MRLHILSDLHLEHHASGRPIPQVEADIVILAGDIHRHCEGLGWARRQFPDTPIIYVPGNHEFYDACMPRMRDKLAEEAKRYAIELLDNRAVTLNGVLFIGTTLWTDFALYSDDTAHDAAQTMALAARRMPDFRVISTAPYEPLTPQFSQQLHYQAVAWLTSALNSPWHGPKVVVSHHAPLGDCIPARYSGDRLSPAFASHLIHLMGRMDMWIHGHVHEPVDIVRSGTRIVANPGGYPHEFVPMRFKPRFTLDL